MIILGFSGTPRDGHGQHQTSGILGKEAFTAAADPTKFPEQLKYVQPWQAKRLRAGRGFGGSGGAGGRGRAEAAAAARWLARHAGAGDRPRSPRTGAPGPYAETGAFNPILGYSYEELAVLSRSMHHSQGTGAMRRPGASRSAFTIIGGPPATSDLFEGIDTTWNRLPGGAAVGAILAEADPRLRPGPPGKGHPVPGEGAAPDRRHRDPLAKIKLAELDETIALCAGLWVEAQARQAEVAPGAHAQPHHQRDEPLHAPRSRWRA